MDDWTGPQRGSPEGRGVIAAERAERDAWRDFFDAVPATTREEFAIASRMDSGVALLACRAVPIVELNRGMGIGVEGPLNDESLDGAIAWLDQHASDGWALQVPPFARRPELTGGLERLALREAGTGWAKFHRSASAPSPDAVVGSQVYEVTPTGHRSSEIRSRAASVCRRVLRSGSRPWSGVRAGTASSPTWTASQQEPPCFT